jgi:thiol-disulfide isomerase/thioredoxin
MKRLLPLLMVFAITLPMLAQEKKGEGKPPSQLEKLEAIQADFQKAQTEFVKAYRAAKNPEEQKAALSKRPNPGPYAERAIKVAQEDPTTEVALEACMIAFQLADEGPIGAKALDLVTKHHITSPKFGPICEMLAQSGDEKAEGILKAALDKNPLPAVKAQACLGLGQMLVELAERETSDPAKSEAKFKAAEEYLQRITKEFADVKVEGQPGSTFGKLADKELFFVRNLAIGKTAPDVVSEGLDGKPAKLSDLRGKVVVLDIWATWCGPCRAMIPHERELVKRLADKPFALVSISADDKKETLQEFVKKEAMPWTHWWDGGKPSGMIDKWNVKFFPTIYVLDHKGVIRFKHVRGEAMDKAVETLLKEMEAKK